MPDVLQCAPDPRPINIGRREPTRRPRSGTLRGCRRTSSRVSSRPAGRMTRLGSPPCILAEYRCQNARPVPVDRADWKQYGAALVEVGKLAHQASRASSYAAFVDISEKLNDVCRLPQGLPRQGGTE